MEQFGNWDFNCRYRNCTRVSKNYVFVTTSPCIKLSVAISELSEIFCENSAKDASVHATMSRVLLKTAGSILSALMTQTMMSTRV